MNRIEINICIITFFHVFFLHLASCFLYIYRHISFCELQAWPSSRRSGSCSSRTPTPSYLQLTLLPYNPQNPLTHHVNAQPKTSLALLRRHQRRLRRLQRRLRKTVPPHPPPKQTHSQSNQPHSTTTELTTSWAHSLASTFGLDPSNAFFEYALRAVRILHPITHTYYHSSRATQLIFYVSDRSSSA
jgi:hypothetical protein